jgi:hypothetical protein
MSLASRDVLRWTARCSGLAVAAAYIALVASHVLAPHSAGPTTVEEWVGIALLSTACLALLVAWRWELLGGVLSLAALAAFAVVIQPPHPWILGLVVLPGVLYLADWSAHRSAPAPSPHSV